MIILCNSDFFLFLFPASGDGCEDDDEEVKKKREKQRRRDRMRDRAMDRWGRRQIRPVPDASGSNISLGASSARVQEQSAAGARFGALLSDGSRVFFPFCVFFYCLKIRRIRWWLIRA